MTLEALKTAEPYVATGAAVVFAFLLVHQCNRADTAEARIQRAEAAAKLRDAGIAVLDEGTERELRSAVEEARNRSQAFRTSLDAAEAEIARLKMKAKPTEIVKWRTAEGTPFGPPLPPEHASTPPGCPPEPECYVRKSTQLAIEATEGRLETREGNLIAVGDASILRSGSPIFTQPIDMKLTSGLVDRQPDPAAERPWIGGVAGTIDKDGKWGVGPKIGYMKARLGADVSLTFPNRAGGASLFGRF